MNDWRLYAAVMRDLALPSCRTVEDFRELMSDVSNPKYREFLHRYFARKERDGE